MDKILKSLEIYLNDKKATQKEIDSFILFVKRLKSSRRVRFIYRGDSNIIEQYNQYLVKFYSNVSYSSI